MHFLIVKTSSIGDIIHSFPVIDYLRAKFPQAKIDWVAEEGHADLLYAHPHLHRVLTVDTKTWRSALHRRSTWQEIGQFRHRLVTHRYDVIFDLQGNSKSAAITALARGKEKVGFGWECVPEKPNLLVTHRRFNVPHDLNIQNRYLHLVQHYFADTSSFSPSSIVLKLNNDEEKRLNHIFQLPRPRYMVAFGSKWRNKRLPIETLKAFLQRLDAFFVFIWENEHEKRMADELRQALPHSIALGNLSLPLWQAVMREMDLVIAMDSAALHLCGTTNTPSFSIFGPSLASVYKPLGDQHKHIQGPCPYGRVFSQRCPILRTCPTGACVRELTVEQLMHSFPIKR